MSCSVRTCLLVPVKDGPHAGTVSAAPVDVQAGGQQDAVLHGDGAMGERRDQELVPACRRVARGQSMEAVARWVLFVD